MSQNSQDASKLWGGRFSQPTNAFVEAFSASIHYDVRLFRQGYIAQNERGHRARQVHALGQTT
ncbi:MAG: argininosuccinate lyase, partial [Magnetococcales bacterium]|nr:argininosuccinate lyase [Magnetococcales bacterium]